MAVIDFSVKINDLVRKLIDLKFLFSRKMSTFREKLTADVKNIQDRRHKANANHAKSFDEKLENYITHNWKLHGQNHVTVRVEGEFYDYLISNRSFLERWLGVNKGSGIYFDGDYDHCCPCEDSEPVMVLSIPLTKSSKYL